MKKRLLFAFAALCTALSGFADGQLVYTPTGRYQIVGNNLCTNSNCIDNYDGWTVVSPDGSLTTPDQAFAYNGAGLQSQINTTGTGMYYKFSSADPGTDYVVSVTITQEVATVPNRNTRSTGTEVGTDGNYLRIIGNSDGTIDGTTDKVELNTRTEIYPGEPVTYSFAIPQDGTGRTYFIYLDGFSTDLTIKDIEIHEAKPVFDDRAFMGTYEVAKAVVGCREWAESDELAGLQEMISIVEAAIAAPLSIQYEDVADNLEGLKGALEDFLKNNMDDYLPNAIDKIPYAASKVSKQGKIGIWQDFGATNRIHSEAGRCYDLGHFQNGNSWANGAGNMGLKTTIDLVAGTYVFYVGMQACTREPVKNSWTQNEALQFAEGELWVKKVVDGTATDTVAITPRYALSPSSHTIKPLVFTIEEGGRYEIAMNTVAKEAYAGVKTGSVVLPLGAGLYAKTNALYTKAQQTYIENVRLQITTARDNITKANAYLENAEMPWGKTELKEAVDAAEPVTAQYEAMTDEEIVATFDPDTYDTTKGLEALNDYEQLARILESEVYINAVKGIIAANKEFESKNANLTRLEDAISAANLTLAQRIYSLATGKADFEAAISAANSTLSTLRAGEYSEENVTLIDTTIETLTTGAETFKNSVPAEYITTVADIDCASDVILNEETQMNELKGAKGVMVLPSYTSCEEAGNTNFSKGYASNGEILYPNLVRVGNGEATVALDGIAEDAIVKVSFDFYFGNLTTKYAGYKIQNVAENDGTPVVTDLAVLYISKYDGKAYDNNNPIYNTFNVDFNANISGVGASTASNDAIAAESNKTSFEIVMDLLTKEMSCTTSGSKGTYTTTATLENSLAPTLFMLKSDYNNADRRCWFSNLKVVSIKGAEVGIQDIVNRPVNNGKIYTISGVQVKAPAKGLYIVNGRKYVVK